MKKRKVHIKDVVHLSSGFTFRQRIEHQPNGGLNVIQAKDVSPNYINEDELTKIKVEDIKSKFFLEKGDILFLAKGTNNFASIFDVSQISIAVSSFFVMKVKKPSEVLPEYVMYYLNSPAGQKQIEMGKEGTYVTNISKKTLEDLIITIPPLEEQRRLCQLFSLAEREIQLTQQLIEKKIELSKSIYNKALS